MAKTRLPAMVTETLDVKWSNLNKPDVNFGVHSANHNITVVITPKLQKILTDLTKKSGAKKLNGMTEKDDVKYIKFKSKTFVESADGKFPCVDAASKETAAVAFGGDKVRLKLQPMVLDRDNSLSLYLNGVQIIEKGEYKPSSGFEPVEGGFDGSTFVESKPTVTKEKVDELIEEDIPF